MALAPGTRLGAYEILTLLGSGGMGEVYRATDTKLGRDVALKILPASFSSDPERVARFRREAQVLATLNHQHIAQIHGLEEANGTQFLVLELIDGESLDKSIGRGPIPVDEALGIAQQVAEALEAAHEKGIIHRDLKPANIARCRDGNVKILDFGLAKAVETTSGTAFDAMNSPTITSPAMMTGVGVILGTAAYMSPEQAKGRPADKRSDVWAFGCVLYEMLTARRAFEGQDVSDTLANVLKVEPEWSALPPTVPEGIQLLMRRCLEKDRTRRVSDASILRFLLTESVVTASSAAVPGAITKTPLPLWRRAVPMVVTALVVASITTLLAWAVWRSPVPPVVRLAIELPEGQRFALRSQVLTISPDGSRVVYVDGAGQLFLRSMADLEAHPISGTGLDSMSPFFSPDGQWIGFYSFQDQTLKKVAVSGGAPVTICRTAAPPHGVEWDGEWIVFADEGAKGILRVSPNGGEPEVLAALKPGEVLGGPQLLDDGKIVLFTVAPAQGNNRWDRAQVVAQRVGSTERTVILRNGSEGRYVPTGHLVYMTGGTLLAAPFDRRTLQVRGGPVPILENVRRFFTNVGSGQPDASFAFSQSGSLVYLAGSPTTSILQRTLALVSRDGQLQPLNLPQGPYLYPRVSPDGSQLAYQTDDGTEAIIWVYDLKRSGPPRRLTFGGQNRYPVWTPDGRRVTYDSDRDGDNGIFWQLADGSQPAERLSKADSFAARRPDAWSPDGKTLTLSGTLGMTSLLTLSPDDAGTVKPFTPDLPASTSTFSPNGKWLAYASQGIPHGPMEVFVEPIPRTGAKYQATTEGGISPSWSADGTRLYYVATRGLHLAVVDIQTRPTFRIGSSVTLPVETMLPSVSQVVGALARNYDVTPDGKQFAVIRLGTVDPKQPPAQQIHVVLNWFTELQQRAPAR